MTQETILVAEHVQKAYGEHVVLKDISLELHHGEVVSMIGPSGAGKSTFLRCLNLLEEPTGGDIRFHEHSILAKDWDRRRFSNSICFPISMCWKIARWDR